MATNRCLRAWYEVSECSHQQGLDVSCFFGLASRRLPPASLGATVYLPEMTRQCAVFVSSTSEDLREYRIAAREAILAVGLRPEMMEYFRSEEHTSELQSP